MNLKLKYKVWLDNDGKAFGEGPYQLLDGVKKHGSLAQAAKDLNMSYSYAHGLMKNLSYKLGFALISSQAGGVGGGGTIITEQALDLMRRYEEFIDDSQQTLEELFLAHFGDMIYEGEPEHKVLTMAENVEGSDYRAPLEHELEPLNLAEREIVALVGGGGKSSIMYALAEELAKSGAKVLITTTTKIYLPDHGWISRLILAPEMGILDQLKRGLAPGEIVAFGRAIDSGKLIGISPGFVDSLAELGIADYILVEADGAAGLPFKAPAAHEPVIPQLTSTVLSIVGIDVLGQPLNAQNCHRPEEISRISGLVMGEKVDGETIARVLLSAFGGHKNVPKGAICVPVINKIDSDDDMPKAELIARSLVEYGADRVVFASALEHKLNLKLWRKDDK